jgi:hypothetical protein
MCSDLLSQVDGSDGFWCNSKYSQADPLGRLSVVGALSSEGLGEFVSVVSGVSIQTRLR